MPLLAINEKQPHAYIRRSMHDVHTTRLSPISEPSPNRESTNSERPVFSCGLGLTGSSPPPSQHPRRRHPTYGRQLAHPIQTDDHARTPRDDNPHELSRLFYFLMLSSLRCHCHCHRHDPQLHIPTSRQKLQQQ